MTDDYWSRKKWTRPGPFGLEINVRKLRDTRVTTLQFGTGRVHAVDGGYLEWITGAPKFQIRYILVCGAVRDQERASVCIEPRKVTCPKCRYRIMERSRRDNGRSDT